MKILLVNLYFFLFYIISAHSADYPVILKSFPHDKSEERYLPDYSYAGYQWGEKEIPTYNKFISVTDFGAVANDSLDDTHAFKKALKKLNTTTGEITLSIPKGVFNLSDTLYLKRSHFILKGAGKGETILAFDRPLKNMPLNNYFKRLKEKFLKEKKRYLGRLFSLYSWSGGVLWLGPNETSQLNGAVSKKIANVINGKRGENWILVDDPSRIKAGQTVKIRWLNSGGKNSSLLRHVFGVKRISGKDLRKRNSLIVTQPFEVLEIKENKIFTKEPLLHDIRPEWMGGVFESHYLENSGIENLTITFPKSKFAGHHWEEGYNAIYLARVKHSWVRNVEIKNVDAGVIVGGSKNVTVEGVDVLGRKNHHSLMASSSYGVLFKNFKIQAPAIHSVSYGSNAKLTVYSKGEIIRPRLDQHRGKNHQNLFENLKLKFKYSPMMTFFHGGGLSSGPVHGGYNTFWNIYVERKYKNPFGISWMGILLNAPRARLVGIHGNQKVSFVYGPKSYKEKINRKIKVKSLYEWQLQRRLRR